MGCTISVFYGDGRFSTYHHDLGKDVDHAYLNNKTHIEQNRSLDLANIHYLPCPTDPDLFRPVKVEKSYDLLFIGNNNSQSRFALLYKIHQRFGRSVAGPDWEGTGLNSLTEAYGSDFFSRLVGQARILLGLMSDDGASWRPAFRTAR